MEDITQQQFSKNNGNQEVKLTPEEKKKIQENPFYQFLFLMQNKEVVLHMGSQRIEGKCLAVNQKMDLIMSNAILKEENESESKKQIDILLILGKSYDFIYPKNPKEEK